MLIDEFKEEISLAINTWISCKGATSSPGNYAYMVVDLSDEVIPSHGSTRITLIIIVNYVTLWIINKYDSNEPDMSLCPLCQRKSCLRDQSWMSCSYRHILEMFGL